MSQHETGMHITEPIEKGASIGPLLSGAGGLMVAQDRYQTSIVANIFACEAFSVMSRLNNSDDYANNRIYIIIVIASAVICFEVCTQYI